MEDVSVSFCNSPFTLSSEWKEENRVNERSSSSLGVSREVKVLTLRV